MPRPLKVLLDECVSSPRTVQALETVLGLVDNDDPPELVFLNDFTGCAGTKDKDWIPKAVEAGFDVVLTTDQGRKKKGDKLPELCAKYQLTHVLVSATLKQKGLQYMTFAIVGAWHGIVAAHQEDTLRFHLRLVNTTKLEVGAHRASLVRAD